MKSFAGLLATSFGISRTFHRKGRSQSLKLMKTFLTVSLFAAVAAITFHAAAQTPPPPPPPAAATTPALPPPPGVATSPGAPGAVASPAAPGVMPSPATGVPGAPATSPAAPGAMPSPVVSATLSAAASPAASPAASVAPPPKTGWTNFLIDNFQKGGPIMWPILIVSIIAVAVVLERAESPACIAARRAAGRRWYRNQTCWALSRCNGHAGYPGALARFVRHYHRADP